MNDYAIFLIGLSFMMAHEMDAIRCKEWRIFPGLSLLNDKWGLRIFVLAHVPILIFIFFVLINIPKNKDLIFWFDSFYIAHFGLHLLLLKHNKNEFRDFLSWIIISGAALAGFIDLIF